MTGIAAATAELYARHNIPSIPLGRNKRPSVGGFQIASLTVDQSRGYIRQRPNANALGVPDGPLSGLVRLDIDEHGDDVLREVIRRAGDTPAKAQTASGKIHLIFADNNERRLTGKAGTPNARPWSDLKVDLCGVGGYSVTPPSQCKGGEYRLLGDVTLEQMLENRRRLPIIQGLEARAYVGVDQAPLIPANDEPVVAANDEPRRKFSGYEDLRQVQVGDRDAVFYPLIARAAKRVFIGGGSLDGLMAEARNRNAEFPVPLPAEQVVAKCNNWWKLTLAGKNRFGPGRGAGKVRRVVSIDEEAFAAVAPLGADAFLLYSILRRQHWGDSFPVANDMRRNMPDGLWTEPRFVGTRNLLLGAGIIRMIAPPNYRANKAALYCWCLSTTDQGLRRVRV